MNNSFAADLFHYVLIFVDDVLTYSKTPNDHLHHLEKVFLTLRRAGSKLKTKKCNLFQTEVHYLGHVIDKGGIRPNPQKMLSEPGNAQKQSRKSDRLPHSVTFIGIS